MLIADIAGYTKLVEQDTDGTVVAWNAARAEVIDPEIAKRAGRIVKYTGDGFLAEFPNVQDVVECAIAMQAGLADSPLDFRMGVNLGDIVDDGTDIHGEGVNIAARIEALAAPGGISVSGMVYESVRNRIEAPFEDFGEHEVKHVSAPVRVYRIRSGGSDDDAPPSTVPFEQSIQFSMSSDGVQIAYSAVGSGPPVIFVMSWVTHLEFDSRVDMRRRLVERLMPNFQLIRYDARGNGLSDWDVENISLEASIGDLTCLIDRLGSERVALIGHSQGAPPGTRIE